MPINTQSKVKVAQSCPTLCNPMDSSLTGSSVHGILQPRILEWVVIPFSRDHPNPGLNLGLPHHRCIILYRLSHQGSPYMQNLMLINLFTHQKQIPEVENEFTVTRVGKVKEVIDREFGIDMYILLYLK